MVLVRVESGFKMEFPLMGWGEILLDSARRRVDAIHPEYEPARVGVGDAFTANVFGKTGQTIERNREWRLSGHEWGRLPSRLPKDVGVWFAYHESQRRWDNLAYCCAKQFTSLGHGGISPIGEADWLTGFGVGEFTMIV
jgi:hypothetical protein